MDYRSKEDHGMGLPPPRPAVSLPNYNNTPNPAPAPPQVNPIRVSAFSRPSPFVSSSSTPITGNGSAHEPVLDATPVSESTPTLVNYRECLRNHAASVGGHVLDGCCEFMPTESDHLKCAACNCHRSFHRKFRSDGGSDAFYHHHPRVPLLLPPPHPTNTIAKQQFPFGGANNHNNNNSGSGATTESSSEQRLDASAAAPQPMNSVIVSKKRFRTKFTAEQKEKMMEFAERVGWRMQRQDEAAVEQFCSMVGVKRQVFKIWMHNNKHSNKKQQKEEQLHQQIQQPQAPRPSQLQQQRTIGMCSTIELER